MANFRAPYVLNNQAALDKYMASDLFKSHKDITVMPHFNGQVTATVLDVMPGTRTNMSAHARRTHTLCMCMRTHAHKHQSIR